MPKSWSKPYIALLKSHSDDWIDSKGRAEKKVIVQEILDHIEGTFGEDEEGPDNLDDKIWNWFGNNVSKKKSPEGTVPKKGNKKPFTIREVIKFTHKAQIYESISKQTEATSGQPEWLKLYPAALTTIIENLTEDELTEAERLAEEWTNDEVPRDVQRAKVSGRRNSVILDDVQHCTGAQIFLMAAYEKPEGTVALSKFQTKPLHRDQFTEVMPMWKLRTWDMWSKYAQAHFSHDGNESDSSANEKSNSKPEKIASFESHPTLGWPMLPKMGNKTSQECKDTMHAFVTETYRNFTRDSQAKVPWKDLSLDEQHELISKIPSLKTCVFLTLPNFNVANARPLIFYASAAVNIRCAKARPSQPKKARHPSPQHVSEEEDNGDNEDDNEDDDEDEADNKKSETPHPHSPAANAASPSSKIDFLCNLSSDLVYTEFVDRLSSRKEQEDVVLNVSAGGISPEWSPPPTIPAAREEWTKMGADAELVVLSMGLALRDINAAHFNEELPEDAPDWLKVSPLDINSAHRLSEIWGKQLQPAKPAMKAKTKANTRTATGSGKRKVPPNDSESEERIPKYKKGKGVKGRPAKAFKTDTPDAGRKLRSQRG
ncbi:hypothetical protein BJV77DRAFT_1068789 [Russula vinacea]|nr:hypothetical protein BJV77DRAFT_1068789 [Russula vinacea]